MEIKSCADTAHQGRIQLWQILGHKFFLLWRAQPDPSHVWSQSLKLFR
jgi:hypothetical protein